MHVIANADEIKNFGQAALQLWKLVRENGRYQFYNIWKLCFIIIIIKNRKKGLFSVISSLGLVFGA